ncbi:MAG TPA: sigma-70 family RNA polymerase sigma factor [Rhizomicrobium sp.]|jgi:RNA polymerase sigma-70 factor (ECF subfamily)
MDERHRRFEALALPHLDAAYNLALWLTHSRPDADDIVQEAMIRALRSFDGFRGDNVKPWLLAIVRNCHLTAAKRRQSRRQVPLEGGAEEPPAQMASPEANPEEASIRAGEQRRLDAVLRVLPEDYREVLILREMEDMAYRDIAQVTGVPIGTVMSRLARARAALRDKWIAETERGVHGLR